MVTDATQTGGRPVLDVVAAAIDGGARAVLVRDRQLPVAERACLAAGARRLLDAVGGLLIVASDAALAAEVGAEGVHLGAADPWPAGSWTLVGRACHSGADLAAAAAEGCSHALLSPVYPSASKPGYGPALGPDALGTPPLPVWALGGITTPEQVRSCLEGGFAGVAVMGGVMRAPTPGMMIASLRSGIDQVDARRAARTPPP